jgi:acetyl-CoA carboxylase biotin carboxyl carrier protein
VAARGRALSREVRMHMDDIRKLIQLLEESGLQEIEITRFWGLGRVRLTKHSKSSGERQNGAGTNGMRAEAREAAFLPAGSGQPAAPIAAPPVATATPAIESRFVAIKSPMVGTFYRAPAPDADPYVEPGVSVEVGQTVCIIEAMKLMNEIESDVRGRIVQVMVENNQPVEYGQALFLVDPA